MMDKEVNQLIQCYVPVCMLVSLFFPLVFYFLSLFFLLLSLPFLFCWLIACIQALERQKEYFDCIRNERDELRDELADVKGKMKIGEVQYVSPCMSLIDKSSTAMLQFYTLVLLQENVCDFYFAYRNENWRRKYTLIHLLISVHFVIHWAQSTFMES